MPIYLGILLISVVPTQYSVTLPGGISNVSEEIIINKDISNEFYSVYVISYDNATLLQTFLTSINNETTVYQSKNKESLPDSISRGKLLNELSYTNALIVAYEEASQVDSSISINYDTLGYIVTYSNNLLKINDIITKIDNLNVLSYTKDELTCYLKNNDAVTFEVIRNRQNLEVTLKKKEDGFFHLNFELYRIITSSNPKYEKTYKAGLNYGPSGGLIQTLSIYSSLLNLNYNLKISGTGTIDEFGRVGAIGGVKEKIYTVNNLVDIFFVPEENYDEALKIYNKLKHKNFTLYKVSDFNDAKDILKPKN